MGDLCSEYGLDRLCQRDNIPLRIERFDLATGRRELWKAIAPPDAAGSYYIGPVLVTRDGRFWAYSVNRAMVSELWQLAGVSAP